LQVLQNEKGVLYTGVLLPPPLSSLDGLPLPEPPTTDDEDASDATALVGYRDRDRSLDLVDFWRDFLFAIRDSFYVCLLQQTLFYSIVFFFFFCFY
jgi:hypothetical protein